MARHSSALSLHLRLSGMAIAGVIIESSRTSGKPAAVDSVPRVQEPDTLSRGPSGTGILFCFALFRELSECLGHIEKTGLVLGVRNLLRQPHAFRGIPTIIDS
jgi:hypothetical protein